MKQRFKKHLEEQFPFLKGEQLLLATSGGLDSVVLAHLMHDLEYNITLAHCNFKLRNEESDGDEKFVRDLAEALNIPLEVVSFDTNAYALDHKLNTQLAARQLRYKWFEEILHHKALTRIITAHHADDNLETFLINLTRGTGLEGLMGIPVQNGNVLRPFLRFSREEIKEYAIQNGIGWREDSSNATDKYVRNALRHHVVPELKKLNSNLLYSFQETLVHLQQANSMVEDALVLTSKQLLKQDGNNLQIDLEQLKRLPNYKAYLYQLLKPYQFTAWSDIYELVFNQSGKQIFSENYRLLKDRQYLILEEIIESDAVQSYEIHIPSEINIPIKLTISEVSRAFFQRENGGNQIFVDKEKLKLPLEIRKWKEGDYFYPFGMKGQKKKVSKFFKDEKMSLIEKENTWLLCSTDQIVWIIGKRADERFKIESITEHIVQIKPL
ncbi:tRNA lysidine(34) synthetase TilS [Flavobacterium sp. '19STA2R22 D10 B1']|uniref:tRNA lysidine(34) synthetase TilS n=1 Tax=Flavobacterium aerium TaxID=3037261 RepID=UPI00278C057A|nr:tRNA lysidine(34) synthetase TilS [Flavobacterium sp. '19STA2R22 D10 B1']